MCPIGKIEQNNRPLNKKRVCCTIPLESWGIDWFTVKHSNVVAIQIGSGKDAGSLEKWAKFVQYDRI
jgi:hypothetical protein